MGRRACCEKIGLKKGPWTDDEDQKLRNFIHTNGNKYSWRAVPKLAGLLRCGKSCRLRWANYLRPDLKNDFLSKKEEKLLIHLHSQFGNKWSQIASHLPGRTDNYIKNYWHNHIKKRSKQIAHKPLFPDPPTSTDHRDTSEKRAEEGREEMDDMNDDMAKENLTIDSSFSIDEIPLVDDHEILIPHPVHHLPSNNCSSSSSPTPSPPTAISPLTIGMTAENFKSLACWQRNDEWNNYNRNMGHSYEDGFTDWNWLFNDFDDKIDHEMILTPPDDEYDH